VAEGDLHFYVKLFLFQKDKICRKLAYQDSPFHLCTPLKQEPALQEAGD
jgi:hypothetical protein